MPNKVENPYEYCTNYQHQCYCEKCERDKISLLALYKQNPNINDFINHVIFSMRLRDQEIVNLKNILMDNYNGN